jgi:hypothetical protein
MKKISIISGNNTECGVFNYGNTIFEILSESPNYRYEFITVSGINDLSNCLANNDMDAIIFNYSPYTLPWISENLLAYIQPKKFLITGHDFYGTFQGIDHTFICDSMHYSNDKITAIPRPLPFSKEITFQPPTGHIKIGSFGFGTPGKNFPRIVQLVNNQFQDFVEINMHISYGHYVDPSGGTAHRIADECRSIANDNVKVNITHNYMKSNLEILKFLNNNNINIFCCDIGPDGVGISSSLDFALASLKPIGIGNSKMYRHMNWKKEISIDHNPIMNIINQGIYPLIEFYDAWSNENLIKSFESQFDKFLFSRNWVDFG